MGRLFQGSRRNDQVPASGRFQVRAFLHSTLIGQMKRFLLCVVMGVLFAGFGLAQNFNASLGGTVTDASGAVIPNATVTATGIETGVATKTTTNTSGAYEFPSLQQGNYRVSAQVAGFKEFVYQRVVLDLSAQVRINFTLTVGVATTTMEVTAAAESPLLAASSVVGGVIQGQQILDLPLIDRSANNLAISQAGFAGGIGTGVNVAGGATQSLLTTVNGINVTNTDRKSVV